MEPSSSLCRAQETYHRDRAASTTLENVRNLAHTAADAWGNQARSAERREARREAARTLADVGLGRKQFHCDEMIVSENPDRERTSC